MDQLSNYKKHEHNIWIYISDIMSGLMLIFLFISILYMHQISKDKKKIEDINHRIKKIANAYKSLHDQLYEELLNEFQDDLKEWNAIVKPKDIEIWFKEPKVLFKDGDDKLRPKFKTILDSFFPRYLNKLMSETYINDIEEVRIEGYTSSDWYNEKDKIICYIENMKLSQRRTRNVLEYILQLPNIKNDETKFQWLKNKLTANGLSSSKLQYIKNLTGEKIEDKIASRRVVFKIRTNAEKRIKEILKSGCLEWEDVENCE